ncbi:MAG TPA: hypothetical protein VII99_05485, partial [Bacteroidia bacterium]
KIFSTQGCQGVLMKKIYKITFITFLVFFVFINIGNISGLITFGRGLGDLAFSFYSLISLAVFLICRLFYKKVRYKLLFESVSTALILAVMIWLILNLSILRGAEHPWDGHIFKI